MNPTLVLLLSLLAVLVLGLVGTWQLITVAGRRAELERRTELQRVEARAHTLRYRLDVVLRRTRAGQWLARETSRAGLDLLGLDLALLWGGSIAFGYLLIDSIAPWWIALIGAAGGWYAIEQFLTWKRNQRVEAFTAQLPELARTLSNATSAGRSLNSALALSARELEDPAASELQRVAEQLRIGDSVDRALTALNERLPSRELGVLVSTLVIQQRTGGDVVLALRDMAESLEARKDLRREVATIMAGAVSTGYVTAGLGVVLLLFLNQMQPGMIDDMSTSWPGRIALLAAGGLYTTAFVLIRRMTRIDI